MDILHNAVLSLWSLEQDSGTPCGGLYQTFTSTSEREKEKIHMFTEKKRIKE